MPYLTRYAGLLKIASSRCGRRGDVGRGGGGLDGGREYTAVSEICAGP